MLISLDSAEMKGFDLDNLWYDPTDQFGSGIAKVVGSVFDNAIINTERIIRDMVDGLVKALQRPISIDYGRALTQVSKFSFASVARREVGAIFMGFMVFLIGIEIGNPAILFGGFAIPALALADHYLD